VIEKLHSNSAEQFATELGTVISHSKPIDSESHLKGREDQLKTVMQAIYSAGRHVFIFGERGVGKTSLAKTAGLRAAYDKSCFKQIGCGRASTFDELQRLVIEVFSPDELAGVEKTHGVGIASWIGLTRSVSTQSVAPTTISVTRAADILASLDESNFSKRRVVVIDEVDRLASNDVREQLAELIKLLGDRGATLTLILTGVGSDLAQILGSHASSFRQLAQIHLERINYQSALDIIDDALQKFGIDWEVEPIRTARFRIASIANGFPYYVHLLTEKLLYAVFEDKAAERVDLNHLQLALASAVRDAQEEIRKPYDRAIRGRNDNYKFGTWAAADSWDLERTAEKIFVSYKGVCEEAGAIAIDKQKFLQILAALKKKTHGPVLKAGYRKGLYEFDENIVRGYVRLCASSEGVELNDLGPDPAPTVTAQARAKRYIDPRRVGGQPSDLRRR
jgi:Cdc6-like AAA superfamily ATPase